MCGARFFIPRFMMPNSFKYRVAIEKLSEEDRGGECSICLMNLEYEQTD